MIAKKYAQIVGVVLLVIAAVGFIAGEDPLLGVLNIDLQEDLIHLLTGGLLTYVGFTKSEKVIAGVVGILGAVYLLVGVIGFVSPGLLGILSHEYSLLDNIIHLALGIAGLVVYFVNSSEKRSNETSI
jgi:hypothetical protein